MWSPWLASMTTSRHQTIIVKSTPARPAKNSQAVCAGRPNRPFIQVDAAQRHHRGRDRADQRPGRRIDQVVVVLHAFGHRWSLVPHKPRGLARARLNLARRPVRVTL